MLAMSPLANLAIGESNKELTKQNLCTLTCFKMNPFLYRKHIFGCDACIVYIDIAKLQMRFLHYAFLS